MAFEQRSGVREAVGWAALEQHLRARPRWRRIGREWHGPCPVRSVDAGKDTCWFRPGSRTPVAAGCRRCGGRLSRAAFRAHLEAVAGDLGSSAVPSVAAAPHIAEERRIDPLPGRVWAAGLPVAGDSPGFRYLCERRGVIAPGDVLPASVRWVPACAARAAGCLPRVPAEAAGILAYRFAGPGEADTWAIQFEAVDGSGRRIACRTRSAVVKRPSAWGSSLAAGRRVFQAAPGAPGCGCWLVEGPLDALALVRLDALGVIALEGAAVFGVAGAPGGFTPRACWAPGPVRVASDGDEAGLEAAARLCLCLEDAGRAYTVRRAPRGLDWSDLARESAVEREGIREH